MIFTGNGRAGSWFIRGEQIGHALGATVQPNASAREFRAHDLIVCVKRVPPWRLEAMRASGRPWVWDVVDCYPQPDANQWTRSEAVRWLRQQLEHNRPDAVIWPNQRMRDDVAFDGPQTVIYHHHRPHLLANPIRTCVRTVGYEGAKAYVDAWAPIIERECARRGWRFVVNPPSLGELDIVLALRGGEWSGYVSEHWKSNVKLANAHGSGTPFIGSRECGYSETECGAELWANDSAELATALDYLTPVGVRAAISRRFLANAYSLDQAANAYRTFLCALKFS